jgi:FkbM family methyltransferase
MSSDANVSRSWHASSLSQLKRIASHIIEAVSPNLFWRLKVRGLRRNLSEDELRIAPLLCDLSKISVDIGSSLGPYAVNICNYSANCIAFEPRPVQAARIREMAAAAGLRIEVEAVALSDSAGLARLRILTEDPGRSTIESANALEDPEGSPQTSIRIPKMRLDDYELPEVGFIKIDVEGHELAVLQGAQKTIRASMPNLLVEIEERHRPGAISEVSAFLTDLGYEGFFILDGEVVPLARFDESVHQDPANIGSWKGDWARHGVYVNNFLFLPACRCGLLSTALSSVHLKGVPSKRAWATSDPQPVSPRKEIA